jgi:hypothetical protein
MLILCTSPTVNPSSVGLVLYIPINPVVIPVATYHRTLATSRQIKPLFPKSFFTTETMGSSALSLSST